MIVHSRGLTVLGTRGRFLQAVGVVMMRTQQVTDLVRDDARCAHEASTVSLIAPLLIAKLVSGQRIPPMHIATPAEP